MTKKEIAQKITSNTPITIGLMLSILAGYTTALLWGSSVEARLDGHVAEDSANYKKQQEESQAIFKFMTRMDRRMYRLEVKGGIDVPPEDVPTR